MLEHPGYCSLRLNGLNNRHSCLTVLGAGSQDQGSSLARFWGEFSSWLADGHQLSVSSQGRRYLSPGSSNKASNPLARAPPSGPNFLPKVPLSNTITLEIGAST